MAMRNGLLTVLCALFTLATAGTASAGHYSDIVMSDGPSNYFRMDDPTLPNMKNEVGGELWGTHTGAPLLEVGGGLALESPNLAVGYEPGPDIDRSLFPIDFKLLSYDAFSIEFLVWTPMESPPPGVQQWYDGAGLVDGEVTGVTTDAGTALIGDGKVGFGMGSPDTTIASKTSINDTKFHHVVATHDGEGAMRLYVDGIIEAVKSNGPGAPRTNGEMSIGALQTDVGHLLGIVDEVAFYRHELSAGDVEQHYIATGLVPETPHPSPSTLPLTIAGGGSGSVLGPNNQRCPSSCVWEEALGSRSNFFAYPATGSRFGYFEGNCTQDTQDSCYLIADSPNEPFTAYFFPDRKAIAQGLKGSTPGIANTLEKSFDDCVKPKKKKAKCPTKTKITVADLAKGQAGGAWVSTDPNGGKLIGSDGATLIGSDGATLIGSDGATLIGSDGATLIGSDGATLIGSDGATLISDKGVGRVQLAGISAKKKKKPKTYVLGRYTGRTDGSGTFSATFKLTKEGQKVMKQIAAHNTKLKQEGRKAIPLPTTFVQVIQPADRSGTGGSFTKIEIK